MAMLSVSLYDSLAGLSPLVVIPAIVKVLPAYIVACATLAIALILQVYLSRLGKIPWAGPVLNKVVLLYFLLAEAYIIGIIYRAYEKRIGWFSFD